MARAEVEIGSTFTLSPSPTEDDVPDDVPRVHMEGHWDDNGPIGRCGQRPALPREDGAHQQVMTIEWSECTCKGCLRLKDKPWDGEH